MIELILLRTNSVVAILVLKSAVAGVTDFGSPVKVGEAIGALRLIAALRSATCNCTNAVLANDVLLEVLVTVGAVGLPVNTGDSFGATVFVMPFKKYEILDAVVQTSP